MNKAPPERNVNGSQTAKLSSNETWNADKGML